MSSTNGSVPDTDDTLTNVKRMASKAVILGNRAKSQESADESNQTAATAVAEMVAVEEAQDAIPFDEFLELLSEQDSTKRIETLMTSTSTLTKMSGAQRVVLFSKFDSWGIPPSTQKDIRSHIAKLGKKQSSVSGEIRKDLKKWGYDLWLNDMDDDVYNGSVMLDDPARAKLRMTARDAGYAEMRRLSAMDDAILAVAAENRKHPIKEYLAGLEWDGQDHIKKLASYFQDGHDPIVYGDGTKRSVFEAFLFRWLVGSVAKVHGDANAARNSFVLTISGDQGSGKSHFAEWLCPLSGYYYDKRINPDDKDYSLGRARAWVWEIGELGATTRRADVEALKNFLTSPEVRERKSYGHADTVKPSIASYIGTVNPDGAGFLVDTTGNRRFAVVDISAIDWDYAKEVDINQVWAQAMDAWRANRRGYRFSAEENAVQNRNAEEHMEPDIVGDMIARVFEIDPSRTDWKVSSSEILDKLRTFAGMSRNSDKQQGKEIARSLHKMGVVGKRSNSSTVYRGLHFKGIGVDNGSA